MRLEQSFEVGAPVERVWAALIDLEQVAPRLAGAAITGHDDDGIYHGTLQVKMIESADAAATLAARGSEKRGHGGANTRIVDMLHASSAGTTATETAATEHSGRPGQGETPAERCGCDPASPAPPPNTPGEAAPPVKGFSLLLSVSWERIRAPLRRR